jgi:hypothetical protein
LWRPADAAQKTDVKKNIFGEVLRPAESAGHIATMLYSLGIFPAARKLARAEDNFAAPRLAARC